MELSKINCSKLRATALVQAIILSRYLFNIGFDFLNDQYSRYCYTQLKNTSRSLSVSSANHWLLLKFRMCSQPTSVNLLKCIVVHRVNCMNNCLRGAKLERTEKLVERFNTDISKIHIEMEEFNAAAVFKEQQEACTKFFRDNLPKDVPEPMPEDKRPENTKTFNGPVYDITGFDAENVVALLSNIVNDKEQFTSNKTFYLLLQNSHGSKPDDKIEELFRLKARPTKNQPGNGIVFLRPTGKKKFTQYAKKYDELKGALEAHYEEDTKTFAQDIKNLFQNNSVVTDDFPQATVETYMILLFEIARRLVTVEKPSGKKEEFDVLPIGSAIARSVKLLELDDKETCRFEDVFLPGGKFHCYTGKAQERRKAIDKINETTGTGINYLKELEDMFRSSKKVPVKKLTNLKLHEEECLSMKSSIDAESNSIEDYSSDSEWTP